MRQALIGQAGGQFALADGAPVVLGGLWAALLGDGLGHLVLGWCKGAGTGVSYKGSLPLSTSTFDGLRQPGATDVRAPRGGRVGGRDRAPDAASPGLDDRLVVPIYAKA